jgi:hypothetical protein
VEFLRTEGIWNSRLLPYSMQLVGLAAFFGRRQGAPTEEQKALLRRLVRAQNVGALSRVER